MNPNKNSYIDPNRKLDIQSAKDFFQYLMDIAPEYNEKPLNHIIDVYEKVKILQPNELFFPDNYSDTDNYIDDVIELWTNKLQIFMSLGYITEDLNAYMQTLINSELITYVDVNAFYKTSTGGLTTSTIDEFKNNSIDFMTFLENYMREDTSERSIAIIGDVYLSYISTRSPFSREDKEKIMAKLEIKDLDYHTILDNVYYKLIDEFKKLTHSHITVFEIEQIENWEKSYEELTIKLKGKHGKPQNAQQQDKKIAFKQTSTFEDVIGLNTAKDIIYDVLVFPEKYPQLAEELGTTTANFLLLYGSAGTGKTLLSRAVANELDATYTEIKEPIQNKYVGESEKKLTKIFNQAKMNMIKTGKNSIIYFDELTQSFNSENEYTRQLVDLLKQILTDDELLTHRTDEGKILKTYVIGSTNHLDRLDPNLIRDGRALSIEVPLPDQDGRELLWKQKLEGKTTFDDINYKILAKKTDGLSGASIVSIINETPYLKGLRLKEIIGFKNIHSSMDVFKDLRPDDPRLQITQNLIEEAIKLYRTQNFDEQKHTIPPEMLFG
ncbi:AAA family ATPase [archaeon]|nr:AAA family ATPase [archaeon]